MTKQTKIISLALAFFATFSLSVQAQITSTQLLEVYSLEDVEGIMSDFGLPAGLIDLQFGVEFYRVEYLTEHPNGELVSASGALCIPIGIQCPLSLTSYQHGTIARKTDAPSFQSSEGMLGVLYASAGYVTAMADYIGLGTGDGFHLYVHAESEANACLDMMRAAVQLQDDLGFELNDQVFLWGYSQGGHATMALQRKIELEASEEFTITASAPMSGPYDISGIQAGVLTSDMAYPTPGYLPYVVLSYQEAYGNIYTSLDEVFIEPYATQLPNWFNGNTSMSFINNQCPDVPSEMLQPAFIEAYETNPDHPMRLALQDNDLLDWAPAVPTQLLYCIGDDQVNYQNSLVAEQAYLDLGSTSVTAIDLGDYDHSFCAPFAMITGYNWFETLREPFFNPEITATIVPSTGSDNGSIVLDIFSPEAYTVSWSTGEAALSLNNLAPGDYSVTLVSEGSCSITYTYSVDLVDGISEVTLNGGYFPNPTEGMLYLKDSANAPFELMDMTGRIVLVASKGTTHLDLSALLDGVYFVCSGNEKPSRIIKQ